MVGAAPCRQAGGIRKSPHHRYPAVNGGNFITSPGFRQGIDKVDSNFGHEPRELGAFLEHGRCLGQVAQYHFLLLICAQSYPPSVLK